MATEEPKICGDCGHDWKSTVVYGSFEKEPEKTVALPAFECKICGWLELKARPGEDWVN